MTTEPQATTNAITAQAATLPSDAPLHSTILLGVFKGPDDARALIRTEAGDSVMLSKDTPQRGLTLLDTGDGWALVRAGETLHRFVIG